MSSWIIDVISQWGYLGIAFLMVAENVFPPIPSELIMPFAGFAAARGDLSVPLVILSGTIGSVLGALPWYLLARILGITRFKMLANKVGRFATLSEDDIDKATRWFNRYGWWAVLFGRLIPGVRTLISVPAGLAAMPFGRFLVVTAIGSAIWVGFLTLIGVLLQDNYSAVEGWLDPISTLVLVAGALGYLYRFVTWKPIESVDKPLT